MPRVSTPKERRTKLGHGFEESPRAYIFQRPFLRGLFLEGLINGGKLRFKNDRASLIFGRRSTVFALFYFVLILREIFQLQAPGGLYLEGRFNGGFFALPV